MKEPTQEQIKEFWEWCGFKISYSEEITSYHDSTLLDYWESPDGEYCDVIFPDVDPTNLFKYAVQNMALWKKHGLHKRVGLLRDWADTIGGHPSAVDPALALFWAIYEVIK